MDSSGATWKQLKKNSVPAAPIPPPFWATSGNWTSAAVKRSLPQSSSKPAATHSRSRSRALKREGNDATAVMDETRALKEKLDELDKSATALDEQMRMALAGVPNLIRDEVPIGKSEEDNVTVKTWGEKP